MDKLGEYYEEILALRAVLAEVGQRQRMLEEENDQLQRDNTLLRRALKGMPIHGHDEDGEA